MKERRDRVWLDGILYGAFPSTIEPPMQDSCIGCAGHMDHNMCARLPLCMHESRKDGRNVIWRRAHQEGGQG